MLITGIKSKPVYEPLRADTGGRYHLMLGSGVGREPLRRVLAQLRDAQPEALVRTQVLYMPAPGEPVSAAEHFEVDGLAAIRLFGSSGALLEDFRTLLEQSLMGTRLYVGGPESFIGIVMKLALEFNLNKDEIRAEECGTLARRIHCIHCRAITEDVRTNVVKCVGCGLWLLVRDHYSRRLAAYMGVMADAEAPGELPEIKEVFL
jgi:dimethylamine monooxygenase subunit C